jgi:DNA-directed RNA polymerase specialized sigma24 family protein
MDEQLRLVAGSEPPAAALAETASFEIFVTKSQTRLFGSLCLMTGSRHEAEEIAQEAYVRVLERWGHVQRLDDPTGYLFVTALNVFRKRLRRAGVALRRSIGMAPSQDAFGAVEDRAVVLGALAQLPLDQRAALVVTALLGSSSEEAGRMLAARPSTIRARATSPKSSSAQHAGDQAGLSTATRRETIRRRSVSSTVKRTPTQWTVSPPRAPSQIE